jgi:hypothetical protein
MNTNELKLIYVLKNGQNVKGEGIYEFIFSTRPDDLSDKAKDLNWHLPAKDNAMPPDKEDINLVVGLKTDYFKLICLHELNDRKYQDGYYKIHAIAFEDENYENDYDTEYDDVLVFHFGETFKDVENKLYKREVIFQPKTQEFIHANKIKFKKEIVE